YLRVKTGATWIAAGERINDSIIRRAMIKRSGSIDRKRARFYPIANWTKKEVLQYIKHHKLKLPADSKSLGFSFKSLEGKELAFVQDHYPDDYQKIIRLYPYAGAAVERWRRYAEQA
ncbi:MAG: phosphoadenosine phosphosulfate reductase family protein, partial [Raoultibacter sp.]